MRDSLAGGRRSRIEAARRRRVRPQIVVSYFRDQTAEEAECEARYADATARGEGARAVAGSSRELGVVCYAARGKRSKLRIVA